jgi:antitoxin YefM
MQAVLYSKLRQNLKKYFDDAVDSHEPIIVTRKDDKNVVILSLEDYNSIKETAYLLSNENNAKHLTQSLENARKGRKKERELIEE